MQITKLSKRRFVKDDLIGERAEYLTHYSDRGIIVSLKWWNKFHILEKKPEWKNGVILLREDRFAFDRFTKLPPEIMRKIIDFVHYDDVINFRKAYRESCACQTFLSELRISKRKRDKKMIECQFRNCTVKYWSKASLSRHMNSMHGMTLKEYENRYGQIRTSTLNKILGSVQSRVTFW